MNGNARNGTTPKTLTTEQGDVPIEVPRDRNSTFEPQLVKKHQRRFTDRRTDRRRLVVAALRPDSIEVVMHPSPRIVVAVIFAWVVCISPRAAHGCSCTNNLTLQEEFDSATGVFSGRVLSVTPSYVPELNWVVLQPITRWKGSLSDPFVVLTPSNGGICGYPFAAGEDYLVFYGMIYFGITYTPTPYTQLCSRTSPLAGNIYVPLLPPPVLPVPIHRHSWGGLKVIYR